jgi:hypothetical protein
MGAIILEYTILCMIKSIFYKIFEYFTENLNIKIKLAPLN